MKPTVSGVFRGNGKEANLAYVSAHWREPFNDKPGIELVFTEKDHSKEKKPDMGAMFGKFGSALIISLHEDGQIYSCQVVHRAHQKQGFSSIGNFETTDFTYEDGKVEGELTTDGQVDTFGEKWEVKIKFVAPLGEITERVSGRGSEKARAKEEKPATADEDDDAEEHAKPTRIRDSADGRDSTPRISLSPRMQLTSSTRRWWDSLSSRANRM